MMMIIPAASILQLASIMGRDATAAFIDIDTSTGGSTMTMTTPLHSSSLPLAPSFVIGNLFATDTTQIPDDIWISLSTLCTEVYNNAITATIPIPDITTIFSTILFVTISDMIPFVPCQPLAISLATVYGTYAYPICVIGQTFAGIIAFQSSRIFSNTEKVQNVIENLNDDGNELFQNFQNKILKQQKQQNDDKSERVKGDAGGVLGTMLNRSSSSVSTTDDDDINDNDTDNDVDEWTVFIALVGLRFAPFFPFSAGNYLLGGATNVNIRSFILATILGCLASNAISVLIGMGVGIELLQQQSSQQ
jgi:uncharacterized membrane protein YdjX (TVP38/TMEM64 family)